MAVALARPVYMELLLGKNAKRIFRDLF